MIGFLRDVIRGKTIYRILFQRALYRNKEYITGRVLDLGSGGSPSYYKCLDMVGREFIKTDYTPRPGVDRVVDFTQPLPFPDASFNTVCIFHALYIAPDPQIVLKEIRRVLVKDGVIVISMPFIANEMPEPHDYHRYTLEGLNLLFSEANFTPIVQERIGERFTAATYILTPFYLFWPIKLIAYAKAILLDKFIPTKIREKHPFPIGYFYVARK
ncbi:MAG: class I SAM-dependent methyltransferase [Candidatus Vogelbacteria bacterium]